MPGLPARAALAAIRFYQRFVSPHKGFCCALRAATGGASCSAHGHAMIARFGLRRGLALLERRFALCAHAHRRLREAAPPRPPPLARLQRQRGACDLPCDCDGVDRMTDLCDLADCCDWESKRGKRRRQERAEREQRELDAALERIRRKRNGQR